MKYILITLAAGVLLLSLAPWATRIRIFEFLDFQKFVGRIDEKFEETKKKIQTVLNNQVARQLVVNSVTQPQ